ncbi:MAG: hypothetical protein RLZ69_1230, partial [Actinomycetota bacterium]
MLRKSLVALIGATLAAVLSAAGVQPAEANLATTAP